MRALASCGIDALEQPLPARDLHGMSALRRALDTPLMADESCFSPRTPRTSSRLDAAELINIKLMKSGGLHPARQNKRRRRRGRPPVHARLHDGEPRRIAAAASLAAAEPNIIWADLDSTMFFEESGKSAAAARVTGPRILLSEEPGLGAEADF